MTHQSWPCTLLGPARRCQHEDCRPVPVLMDAPPAPPPGRAGGLTDDQVIRIHALAAAVQSKPHMEPVDQMRLADRYALWIKTGGDL
jgi:hypothetical protein